MASHTLRTIYVISKQGEKIDTLVDNAVRPMKGWFKVRYMGRDYRLEDCKDGTYKLRLGTSLRSTRYASDWI